MASNMTGKTVKFALGTRESLNKCDKILQQVDIFIDGESGILYIVPQEEELEQGNLLKNSFEKMK